ncbi:hypothetical protein JK358_02575 [Nocardia sp. 2]|uniref:Glycerophosphoryl diester phosphodiesterase membrane domain-containing protein n=1 Tax=Nocardia acididurans TaxID=2802282 RepID=A0ABS1LY02_9NOCA|nr:hypothetical protein [Nocardia acididurans]MBL1073273.1 hypothetical protein [Nocardia acididurans]
MLPAAADNVGKATGAVGETLLSEPSPVPIRPMQFRELLDLPFALIQPRVKTFGAVFGVGVLVASAIAVGITVVGSLATGDDKDGTRWSAVIGTLVCAWLLRLLVRGVTVSMGLAAVRQQAVTWRWALRQMSSEAAPLLGYSAMFTLIGIGVLALGTPLIITLPLAAIWLAWLRARRFTTVPIIFDESATYRTATARAKMLVQGTEWQIVGVWLYLRGLMLVLMVPLLAVPGFLSGITGTRRWTVTVLLISVSLLMIAFAEMVESSAQVVAYVDRRCRREAWDIRVPPAGGQR